MICWKLYWAGKHCRANSQNARNVLTIFGLFGDARIVVCPRFCVANACAPHTRKIQCIKYSDGPAPISDRPNCGRSALTFWFLTPLVSLSAKHCNSKKAILKYLSNKRMIPSSKTLADRHRYWPRHRHHGRQKIETSQMNLSGRTMIGGCGISPALTR